MIEVSRRRFLGLAGAGIVRLSWVGFSILPRYLARETSGFAP